MGGNFFLDIFSFFFVKKINNLNVLDNDPSVCFYSTRNTSRSKTLNLHSVFLFSLWLFYVSIISTWLIPYFLSLSRNLKIFMYHKWVVMFFLSPFNKQLVQWAHCLFCLALSISQRTLQRFPYKNLLPPVPLFFCVDSQSGSGWSFPPGIAYLACLPIPVFPVDWYLAYSESRLTVPTQA